MKRTNPFKLYRSYIGAFIAALIPLPIPVWTSLVFAPNVFLLFYFPFTLISLSLITSGFLFFASFKKGNEYLYKYSAISLILVAIFSYLIVYTNLFGVGQ